MLYFIRDLETACAESPMTAQAAQRYSAAQGWRAVDRAEWLEVWEARDTALLTDWRDEARADVVQERAVGEGKGGHIY